MTGNPIRVAVLSFLMFHIQSCVAYRLANPPSRNTFPGDPDLEGSWALVLKSGQKQEVLIRTLNVRRYYLEAPFAPMSGTYRLSGRYLVQVTDEAANNPGVRWRIETPGKLVLVRSTDDAILPPGSILLKSGPLPETET